MKSISYTFFTAVFTAFIFLSPVCETKAQTGKDTALETLGMVSGMMLYNSYIAIGAIGDGESEGVYTAEEVQTYMDEQIGGMVALKEQMAELKASGFLTDPSDKQYVDDIITALGYLGEEAEGLKSYMASGSEKDLAAYDTAREKAWAMISGLLGLDE